MRSRTACLGLAVLMVTVGLPDNTRVIAAPPVLPPIVVPAPAPPIDLPAPVLLPPLAPLPPAPEFPPPREPDFKPPVPVNVNHCWSGAPLGFFAYPEPIPSTLSGPTAQLVAQAGALQRTYEATTGQPLGVDLPAMIAFATACSDALPNADALVALAKTLSDLYAALAAAGVPPIDLPAPPVVPLPAIPGPLQPVIGGIAPAVLPICDGLSTVLALSPIAFNLLPFPSSEALPYLWPARATCALFRAYAPPPA